MNTLWALRSVVLLWETPAVEWYYPGLTAGATHAVVNRSTAVGVVERLLSDPDLVAALSRSAKKVQSELLCADCIADHINYVANLTRERMNYGAVLDDPNRLLALAKRTGACKNFVRVKVLARSVNQKFAAAGEGLCEMLERWSRGRALSEPPSDEFRQRWAPADEFARLHEGHNVSERVEAELNRSLQFFTAPRSPVETEERLAEMLSSRARVSSTSSRISPKQIQVRGGGGEIRDYAVLVLWGDVFMARPYVSREKGAGHGVLLRTAWQRRPYGNVAFLHLEHESGGDGNCLGGRAERWPTTVIAKRKGYKQCGILVPNPYFGSGGLDGTCGILDRWQAKADEVIAKAKKRPLTSRTAKAFWRGDCRLHGKKPCIHEHGNQLRMLGVSLTSRRPDLFDARCKVHRSPYRPPTDFSCVADADRLELENARRDVLKRPPTTQHVAATKDFSQWRYVLNLPGRTTGSYSRNLNHLWASRSVVLLWDTKVVEWYYPALSSGITHAVVNRSSAIAIVSKLNSDPALVTALSHAAKHVHNDFVSADAIALYLARVATLTRERMGYAAVLDDAKQLLALAQRTGACDHFVRVDVRGYTVKGSRKYAEAGEGLCEVLRRRASVP